MFLRQSTASQEIILGTFLDDTDGKTPETGLTIANTDIKLFKAGQTTEANKNSGGATHIAAGRYSAVLDATDTDTVGVLEINVAVSGALPVRREYTVLEEAVFDRLFATDAGGYQVPIWSSASATVNLSATTIKTATDVETDTQDIQARLPSALVDGRMAANAQVVGDKTGYKLASDGLALVTAWTVSITGNLTGSVSSISGVTFPSNFGALNIDPSGAMVEVIVAQELGSNALRAQDLDVEIAAAVWDEAYSGHTTAGTFGKLMDVLRKANTLIEGTVTSAVSPTATAFTSNVNYPTGAFKHAVLLWVTGSLNEQNSPILTYSNTNGAITVEEAFTAAPQVGDEFVIIPTTHVHSVAAIADGVWDEPLSGHLASGSTGEALNNSGGSGNPWITDIATGYSGTQAGNILNQVKAKTDLITSGTAIQTTIPVTAQGQITGPLYIGDDYLTANGRQFDWTVALPSGFVAATATCKFGMAYEDETGVASFNVSGTVADVGSGNVRLRFELPRATTETLKAGFYRWSVEIASAGGTEITRVAYNDRKLVEWREKQT